MLVIGELLIIFSISCLMFIITHSISISNGRFTSRKEQKILEFEKKPLKEIISESLGDAPEGAWWEVSRISESNRSSIAVKLGTVHEINIVFYVPLYEKEKKLLNRSIADSLEKKRTEALKKYNAFVEIEKTDWEGVF